MISGLAPGAILCTIGIARILVWHTASGACGERLGSVAIVVGASLVGVVLFGTMVGSMLPLGFAKVRAGSRERFRAGCRATIVDVSGLVICFSGSQSIPVGRADMSAGGCDGV